MGIENWDTSIHYLIYLKLLDCAVYNFNQDLSKWKTTKVTDMSVTFYNAKKFNSPLNSWDTYNVTNMQSNVSMAHAWIQSRISNWKT